MKPRTKKNSMWPHYRGNNVELMLCGASTMRPPFTHVKNLRLVSYVDNYINNNKSSLHMRVGNNRKIKEWLDIKDYNKKLDSYWMRKCKFDIIDILQQYDKGDSHIVINASTFKRWKRSKIEERETYYRIKYDYDFLGGKIILEPKTYIIMTTSSLVWPLKSKNEFIEVPMVNLEKISLKT